MSEKGSVFQKGGGGTNFEQYIQAAFLTTLIVKGNAPCLPANEISEVSFQNTNKGYQTDDLLVVTNSILGKHRLLFQIKHEISLTSGNNTFQEVMQAFWKDYCNPALFDKTKDKLIIVKNGLTKDERNHVKSLCNWANSHASEADFVSEVDRIDAKKKKLQIFHDCLNSANNNILTDKELWEFLKCFDILEYDFLNQGSVDESYFLNLIKLSKSQGGIQNEREIWNSILVLAGKLNKNGGNATTESIQKEELIKNFSLEKLNPYFKGVDKLRIDGQAILKPLKNTIGGLHINRSDIKELIVNSLNSFKFTIVTGKPGVGKSAEIKDILSSNFPSTGIFVFKADQFNQPHIANVFSSQGVNETIIDIFSCISLIPDKVLFIDSLEKLLEADPECAFRQLFSLLDEFPDIKVIASSRKYAIDLVIQKFGLNRENIGVVEVLPLDDNELNVIAQSLTQLIPVLKNQKIRILLQSPKYIDFAVTALNKNADDYTNITFTDFKNKLWDSLVVDNTTVNNGLPIKRERAFMEIAIKRAREMKLFIEPTQSDEEAILMLEKDEIIVQEYSKRKYSPTHDILEDWALVKYVSTVYEDFQTPKGLFENLGNEPAIRRAFRLWVEDYLIDDKEKINRLVRETLNDNSIEGYWADELLVAIFKSDFSNSIFESFEKELVENNGIFLNRCLHLIKTCCKESNNSKLLFPIGSGWKEALLFIEKNIEKLDYLRLSIINFLSNWYYRLILQYSVADPTELVASKNIILYYIDEIESHVDFWKESYVEDKVKQVVSVLFGLALIANDEIKNIIDRGYENKKDGNSRKLNSFYKEIINKSISGLGNERLIEKIPEYLVSVAWKEWKLRPIKEPEPGSLFARIGDNKLRNEQCWGIEDRSYFFPSGVYKTFVYNLLKYHPISGLKFLTEFINYSVDFYVNSNCEYKHQPISIEIELNDGVKITQWASWELWAAYRGLSVTNYALETLLISLEKFLIEVASQESQTSQSNLTFIFSYLLNNSNNIAITSVLASVSIAYPQEVDENMLPLLRVKEFYEWDLSRAIQEHSALSPMDDDISFAQEERYRFNNLPHRRKYRRGLRDFILDYQFNIGKLNSKIHQIFDKLKLPFDDIVWKKSLTEMDIRNHKVGEYDEKLGGYIIQAEYGNDVAEFIASNKESNELELKSINFSSQLKGVYEENEKMEFSDWEICFKQYFVINNLNLLYDRPITLAAIGLRDFSSNLSDRQMEWCIETLVGTVTIILKDKFEGAFGMNMNFNLMEKEIALSSFHLIRKVLNEKEHINELLVLIIYVLFAPFGAYEINKITNYIKTIFFENYPLEAKIVWVGLIKYAQFRKANPYRYSDSDIDRLQAAREREALFINEIVKTEHVKLDVTNINFDNCEGYLLIRSFAITPYYIEDEDFWSYIHCFVSLLTEDLKHEREYSHYGHRGERQISLDSISELKSNVSELLLKANGKLSESVMDLIIDANHMSGRGNDLYNFSSNCFEYVIYKLDDIIANSKDELFKNQLIVTFWELWAHFFLKVKTSGNDNFVDILLFDIKWDPNFSHWIPFEGKKDFYYEMINSIGINKTKSVLNVFSLVGEKTFLPEGLSWLAEAYKMDITLLHFLISPSAERLIKRLFYNHITQIKRDKKLIEDFIWILNKMVDQGSSDAYFFRENTITYKTRI